MVDSLYSAYAHIFRSIKNANGDLNTIFDTNDGFAPRLRVACQKVINEAESLGRELNIDDEDIQSLKLERDTWDLLQNIYGARKTVIADLLTPSELLQNNPFATPKTIVNHLIQNSTVLTELLVTREWLRDTAPSPQLVESAPAYRNFTRLNVLHNQRVGPMDRQANLVKELDPDATIREAGMTLAGEDAAYEKALLHSLYTYIRAGQSEQAMDLCRSAHRPWLAAALQGYRLFDWEALSNPEPADDAMDQDAKKEITGNKRRRLWKKTCTTAALDPNLAMPERVLSAALAPSRKTLAILVKEACKTWEDHLWARVATLLEEKVSEGLTALGPNFWDKGNKEPDEGAPSIGTDFEALAVEEMRDVLSKMADINVDEGPGAGDPFHVTQLRIIMDQAETLLKDFASYLTSQELSRGTYELDPSFFVSGCPSHMQYVTGTLVSLYIDVEVDPLASQTILEAYVSVLQEQGQTELIAQYAAALGDNAVTRYALFLADMPISASTFERRDTLLRARDYGLNVVQVALNTADLCRERAFKALPKPSTPYPFISSNPRKLTDPEKALINSIDWLAFEEATYRHAVIHFNTIMRYFLGSGNLHACHEIRERRPPPLRDDPPGSASDRYEYLHFERFFIAWSALSLAEHYAAQLTRPEMDAHTRERESIKYENALEKARELIVDLLTHGWLQIQELNGDGDQSRQAELLRIREMYVPELVIRLHRALCESRSITPRNLRSALLLINIVADSRFELYDAFQNPYGNRLPEYLQCIKDAVIDGLSSGGSDPFRVIVL
ncbi:hypothetical protein Clacol_009090 [Clathrus columnatus]|uniref:Nuclear pore complex protein n=1 Tax=Clathrus columnatus TaxID=1419009 RepID=A0AAV5AJK2_9AGAM|nr:hypothetical protein Clacol_009090 [Clathrus columnatus]